MDTTIKRGTLCSLDSLEADEDMYGTATRVDTWLILEYNGRWSGEAFRDSQIPENAKARISRYMETRPNSRLQLVKKQEQSMDGIKLYIARSEERKPRLYEFTINKYEELLELELDIDTLIKDGSSERREPIFLICTNGEHDRCCGKFGMPVFLDIAQGANSADALQTTHIGGHRFSTTFVCLPHGLYYGRVREGKRAEEIIDEYKNGKIDLGSYRGRSCYNPPVQTAEYFLRKETGLRNISDLYIKEARENDGEVNVEFFAGAEEKIFNVSLRKLDNAWRVLKSCGDKERSFIPRYSLLSIGAV
ncbi:MAG: sucrase ferredoxin [Thermodesulfobacteriota bacterium]